MTNRIKLIRKELNLTQEALALRLGITKSAVSMIENGHVVLSERNRNIILRELGVSARWLQSGRGPVLDPLAGGSSPARAVDPSLHSESVPLYDLRAAGGLTALLLDPFAHSPADHIHIPGLPLCDGAVAIAGDGMYPLLAGGDIVLYGRTEPSVENILWGEMYLLSIQVDHQEYIAVRYIRRADRPGYVILAAHNPRHADREVRLTDIDALALVKASIRMNFVK